METCEYDLIKDVVTVHKEITESPKVPWKSAIKMLTYALIKMGIILTMFTHMINELGFWIGLGISILISIIINILLKFPENKYLKEDQERIAKWKLEQTEYENYMNTKYDEELKKVKQCQ